MSINVTLFVQMLVFGLLVWFTMTFVWPVIRSAMDEREQRIADGLAAAERGQGDLRNAKVEADKIVAAARDQAREIVDQAGTRATDLVDQARSDGESERKRQLEAAQAEIQVEINRARDELRGQVAAIAVAGAQKILAREIDSNAHKALLDELAAEL
jgi:F-type H+-transporting ATPase subunit b